MFGAFVVQFWARHDSVGAGCRRVGACPWPKLLRNIITLALKEMGR